MYYFNNAKHEKRSNTDTYGKYKRRRVYYRLDL